MPTFWTMTGRKTVQNKFHDSSELFKPFSQEVATDKTAVIYCLIILFSISVINWSCFGFDVVQFTNLIKCLFTNLNKWFLTNLIKCFFTNLIKWFCINSCIFQWLSNISPVLDSLSTAKVNQNKHHRKPKSLNDIFLFGHFICLFGRLRNDCFNYVEFYLIESLS